MCFGTVWRQVAESNSVLLSYGAFFFFALNDFACSLYGVTENIGTRFKTLAYERAKQRNRLRRMHDSTAMQPTKEIIYDLTAQMAGLRRQMKLCEDIAERCGVIEMVVNEIERGQIAEKKKPAEKKKCEKGIDIW